MDRRSFITANKSASRIEPSEFRTFTGLSSYTPPFSSADIIHLLKRTLFGVKQSDIDLLSGKALIESLDLLLTTSAKPSPPVNNYNDANYTDPNVPAGQTWVNTPFDGTANSRRYTSFKSWWTGLMLNQVSSIHEKMVLFWHNHFATETQDIGDARYVYKHNALLRSYALGNFKQLVKEVTIDPAMLRYLNGYINVKTSPDENYARELQELFTLGKGPKSNYSENDEATEANVIVPLANIFRANNYEIKPVLKALFSMPGQLIKRIPMMA